MIMKCGAQANCAGLARSVAHTMLQVPLTLTPPPPSSHSTVLLKKRAKEEGILGQADLSDFGVFAKVSQ